MQKYLFPVHSLSLKIIRSITPLIFHQNGREIFILNMVMCLLNPGLRVAILPECLRRRLQWSKPTFLCLHRLFQIIKLLNIFANPAQKLNENSSTSESTVRVSQEHFKTRYRLTITCSHLNYLMSWSRYFRKLGTTLE